MRVWVCGCVFCREEGCGMIGIWECGSDCEGMIFI